MMQHAPVSVCNEGDIAWICINNPLVNATSNAVRRGLELTLGRLENCKVAVLFCEGKTFVAGGDMSEFDSPPESPHLPDVVQAIEDSVTPVIALMHGSVLGGGFEIAMACAWRISTANTVFGLPEVNVGLVPGAGGTQRLPRLIGMEAAVDVACGGKVLSANDMLALGGLDLVVEANLKDAAREFVASLPQRPLPVTARDVTEYDNAAVVDKFQKLTSRAKGQQSPKHNMDALNWATLPFAEGQPRERALHLELRNSAESRALRHAFFSERAAAKPAAISDATPREIKEITVVGGGLMGAGIATRMLTAGLSITLIERDDESANLAQTSVVSLLDGALKRRKITEQAMRKMLAKFRTSTSYSDAKCADLAIEAVFEDVAIKAEVFKKLDHVVSDSTILATNTSYLDPRDIFEGISNPNRCLGLHFFSPAHIMKLLEVIKTPATSPEVLASCFALGKPLRTVSVLSGICDGFIGNRMLAAYRREADYLLADGALPFQIDAAMRGFGMPMGPYELQDLTGLQIAWATRKRQAKNRDGNERYIEIADQLCEMNRFGQRSGKGWYSYVEGSRTPHRDEEVENMIIEYSTANGIQRRDYSNEQIVDRMLAVLVNEGACIVEEGIAERMSDIDMVQIHGYGFPRWRGGPMMYADNMAWDAIATTMRKVSDEAPNSWKLAERFS